MAQQEKDFLSSAFKQVKPTGDAFADDCFSFDLSQESDTRQASRIEELKEVPGLIKAEEFEAAGAILNSHRNSFADFDFIYVWQSIILQRNGEPEKATEELLKGLKHSKSKHVLCDRLGLLSHETGQTDQAVKWWIRSIALMLNTGETFMWEPFLYMSYIARACGREDASELLMAQVAKISVHGALELETDAEKKLYKNAENLPKESVVLCIDLLFERFDKALKPAAGEAEPDKKTRMAEGTGMDHKRGDLILPPEKNPLPKTWLALGAIILIGLGLIIYLFFFPAAPDADPPEIIHQEKPVEMPPPLPAGEQESPGVKEENSEEDNRAGSRDESPVTMTLPEKKTAPTRTETVPNKKKIPYLKVKTKTSHPDIKKK